MTTYSRPNFLASEVGLKLDTIGLDAETHTALVSTEDDRKIIKQGTIYSDASKGIYGLIFQDVDVTGSTATTQVPAPLMTAGHFINKTPALPKVVDADLAKFTAQGLFADPVKADSVTRPY